METCGTGIGREKSMNKKAFKEPKIPEELAEVKDGAELIQTAREEEGEIFRRQFTGIFLSRIDGNHIFFQQVVFRNFRDAGMDAVRMSYVKIYHSDFTDASLSKCNITNVDWKDDCFKNASFFKTWLKDIDFTECDITGIVISDAKDELREVIVNLEQAIVLAKRLGIVIKELEK